MHGNHIFFNITQNENCCHLWRMCVNTQTETHMCGQIYAYMHVCKYIRVDAAASCQRFVAICYARHSYINMQQQNVFHRLWDEVATVLHATKLFLFLLYHYFIHHMCCIIHNFVDFCVVTVFLLRLLLLLLLLFFSFLLLSLLCAFAPRRIIAIAIASGKCSSLQLRQLAAARVPSDMLFIFLLKLNVVSLLIPCFTIFPWNFRQRLATLVHQIWRPMPAGSYVANIATPRCLCFPLRDEFCLFLSHRYFVAFFADISFGRP